MSVEAITAALPRRGLTPTQKLVLIGIANHDGDGGAWPSIATLANYAECSTRQVQRAIAELVDLGLVERHINEGGTKAMRDHTRPNLYVLHLTDPLTPVSPPDLDVTPPPDLDVTPPVTPVSPEPSFNRPGQPSVLSRGVAVEVRSDSAPTPYVVPDTPIDLGETAKKPEDSPEFMLFWETYGKVGPRLKAWECWVKARRIASAAEIQAGLEAWCAYWRSPGAANVKWPQGWLNERRWEDDPPTLLREVQRHDPKNDAIREWLNSKAAQA